MIMKILADDLPLYLLNDMERPLYLLSRDEYCVGMNIQTLFLLLPTSGLSPLTRLGDHVFSVAQLPCLTFNDSWKLT